MDVPGVSDSALALHALTLAPGMRAEIADDELDTLVFVSAGSGRLVVGDEASPLRAHDAGLVLAGEEAELEATGALEAMVLTAGAATDLHAPMGTRETVVSLDDADQQRATGARSFQILFGPHNGSTRATLFAGYVPPGKAPWHYPSTTRSSSFPRARVASTSESRSRSLAQARPFAFDRGKYTSSRTRATPR